MKNKERYELAEKMAKLLESHGLKVDDLTPINDCIEEVVTDNKKGE